MNMPSSIIRKQRSKAGRSAAALVCVTAIAAGILGLGASAANASIPDPGVPPFANFSMYSSITSSPATPGFWAQPDVDPLMNQPGTTVAGGGAPNVGTFGALDGGGSVAATLDGGGLYYVSPDGTIQSNGDANLSLNGMKLDKITKWTPNRPDSGGLLNPIVGIAASSNNMGFWALDADGNVYGVGSIASLGQPGSHIGDANAVDIKSTRDGKGYVVLADDGGTFNYGDAVGYGHPTVNAGYTTGNPAVGIAYTSDDKGYWIAQADGTVTAWGDAPADSARQGNGGHTIGNSTTNITTNYGGGGYYLVSEYGDVTPVALAPTCFDQKLAARPGQTLTINLQCEYGAQSWQIVADPEGSLNGFDGTTGSILYTAPMDDYDFTDMFTYTATDSDGHVSNVATVSINVYDPNGGGDERTHTTGAGHVATAR